MPFRFSLRALLRWRENRERRELLRLSALIQQAHSAERRLRQQQEAARGVREEMTGGLQAGLRGAEIRFDLAQAASREAEARDTAARLAKLREALAAMQAAYRRARQARQTVERLRERRFEQYRQAEEKRAQQQSDELFLIRRGARPG